MALVDIPIEEYHQHPAISRSGIMEMQKTQFHYWHRYLNPRRTIEIETDSMAFGRAFHTKILEPDEFNNRYAIIPKVDRRSAAGKAEYAKYQSLSLGKEILSEDDFIELNTMQESIKSNKLILKMILGAQFEKSIFWTNEETGIDLKCRPDILRKTMVIDLKTTKDASERAFTLDALHYGYHIQAAMIRDGLRSIDIDINSFWYIVCEKSAPYPCALYKIDDESIELGRYQYIEILKVYKQCREKNNWPAYKSKIIGVSKFFKNKGELNESIANNE